MVIIGFVIPSPLPIGVYWPVALVCIPSAVLGFFPKIRFVGFSFGLLAGGIGYVAFHFHGWAQLNVLLAAMHVAIIFAALIIFSLAWGLRTNVT